MSTPRKQTVFQATPSRRRNTPLHKTPKKVSNDQEEGITVAIRMRPLNTKEKSERRIWKVLPKFQSVTQTTANGRPLAERIMNRNFFTFDKTFGEESTTRDVYDSVAKGIVDSVVSGLNGTIFAYGQTSSGKTYTMQGSGSIEEGSVNGKGGVVHMAAQDIFSYISQKTERVFLVRVSFVEIYNEEVRDLLDSNNILQIREDPRRGVFVNAEEVVATDFSSLLQNLFQGERNRAVAATGMNERSSRSHTIFRITIESRDKQNGSDDDEENSCEYDGAVRISTLNLVDLAGSESVRHTGNTGDRLKEGAKINMSLMTLSRVIVALGQPNQHINYRDSKLTRILQPSLSGNARMAIVCCATPSELYFEDTRSTLMFASRAKLVKTNAQVNEVLDDQSLIRRLQRELAEAKKQSNMSHQTEQLKALETQAANAGKERREVEKKLRRLQHSILNTSTIFESKNGSETNHKNLPSLHKKRRLSDGGLNLKISSPVLLSKSQVETPKTAPDDRHVRRKLLNDELSSDAEISLVRKAVTVKGARIRLLEDDVQEKEKLLETTQSTLREIVLEKEALNSSLMLSQAERNEYNTKMKELAIEVEATNSKNLKLEEKAKKFEQELETYREESEELIKNLEVESKNFKVSLNELKIDTDSSILTLTNERNESFAKVKELENQLESAKSEKDETNEKITNLEKELKRCKENAEELVKNLEIEKENFQVVLTELKLENDSSLQTMKETCELLTLKVGEADRIQEELKESEAELVKENANLVSEVARLTSQLSDFQDQREKDKQECRSLYDDISRLNAANKEYSDENAELKTKLTLETENVHAAEQAKEDALNEVEKLSQNVLAYQNSIDQLNEKSELMERDAETARKVVAGKEAELYSISEALENEKIKSKNLSDELEKASEENHVLNQSVATLQGDCCKYKEEFNHFKENLQLKEEQLKIVTSDLKNATAENEALKVDIENLERIRTKTSEEYEKNQSVMILQLEELNKARDVAYSDIKTLKGELESMTDAKEEVKKQFLSCNDKAQEQEHELEQLGSQIITMRNDFQLECSKFEEEKRGLENEIKSLNENFVDLQTKSQQMLDLQKKEDALEIAKLHEDQEESNNCLLNLREELRIMTVSKEDLSRQLSISNNRIQDKEKEIENLGSQLMAVRADFQLEYSKLEEEKAELSLELNYVEKDRVESKLNVSMLQAKLNDLESKNQLIENSMADIEAKRDQLQSTLEEKEKVISANESEILLLQEQSEANEARLNDQEALLSKLRDECTERQNQLDETIALRDTTEESLKGANHDLDQLKSDLEEKANLLLKADHKCIQLQDQMSILESQSHDFKLLIEKLQKEHGVCKAAMEEINVSKQTNEEELGLCQSEVIRLNSIIEEKDKYIDDSKSKDKQLQDKIRALEATMINRDTLVESLQAQLTDYDIKLKENLIQKERIDEDLARERSDMELLRSEISGKMELINVAEQKNCQLQEQIDQISLEADDLHRQLDEERVAKEMELQELDNSKTSLRKELDSATSKILQLQDDVEERASALSISESKLSDMTQQIAEYERRLFDQEASLKEMQDEAIDREMMLKDTAESKTSLEEYLLNAKADMDLLQSELAEKNDMLSMEQSQNKSLKDQICAIEMKSEELDNSKTSVRRELDAATSKILQLQDDVEERASALSISESKLSDMTQQIAEYERRLFDQEASLKQMQDEAIDRETQLANATESLLKAKADTDLSQSELAERNEMLSMEQNRNINLQDQITALTEESSSLKNHIDELQRKISLLQSQVNMAEELNNSNHLCQEKLAIANSEIEQLRKEISEKAKFLQDAEQKNMHVEKQILEYKQKVIDEETELRGTNELIQEELNAAKSEIKDLQSIIDEKSKLLADSTSEVKELKTTMATKNEMLTQSEVENQKVNEEIENKARVLEAEKVELVALLSSANQSVKEARDAALAADDELEMKERKLEEIINQFTICEEDLKLRNNQVTELQQQLNAIRESDSSNHELLLRLEKISEEKANIEDQLLKERLDRSEWEETHKRKMGEEQRLLVKEGERAMSSIRTERDQLKSALSQCETQICNFEQEKEDLILEKKKLELNLSDMPKLNAELSQLQSALFNLQVENKNLLSKIKSMSEDKAFRKSKEDEEIATLTAELSRSRAESYEVRQNNMDLEELREKLEREQRKLSANLQIEIQKRLALEASLREREKEVKELKNEDSRKENFATHDDFQKQKHEIDSLMKEIKNKDMRIEKLEKVRLTKEKCAVLKKLKEDHNRFQEENKSYKKKLAIAQQEISALRSESLAPETEQKSDRDAALKFEKEALETKLKKYIKYCKRLESDKTQILDALRSHKRDVIDDDFSGAVVSLCDQLASLEEECDALSSAEGKASSYLVEIENHRKEIASLQDTVKQLKNLNTDSTSKMKKLQSKNMALREERDALRNRSNTETGKSGQVKYLEQENLQLILDLKTTKKKLQSTQAKLEELEVKALDNDDTDDFSVFPSVHVNHGVSQSPLTEISPSLSSDKENKMLSSKSAVLTPGKQTGAIRPQSNKKRLRPSNTQRAVGLGEAGDINEDNTQECRQS